MKGEENDVGSSELSLSLCEGLYEKKIRLLCKCIYIKEYEMMGLQGREKSGKNRGIEPKRQRKQAQMKINERQNLREQSN